MSRPKPAQPVDEEADILLSEETTAEESDDEIQTVVVSKKVGRPKEPKPPSLYKKYPDEPPIIKPPREKKPVSQNTLDALQRGRETRAINLEKRREYVNQIKDEIKVEKSKKLDNLKVVAKKEMEQTIVRKAVAIKKKQIKAQAVLEEISDDETPIEEIRKIIAKPKKPVSQPQQRVPQQPVYQPPSLIFF